MNLHCRFVGLAIFASANFLQFQHLLAQTPGATATIRFSNGQSLATNDFSDLIGVQPNELVNVTIQFPAGDVGETIKIASLDGGQVTSSSRTVSDEGFLTFSFQAPPNAGQDRVVIRHGSQTLRLQFWVLSSNPQNNPPVITPANPEG